MPSAKEKTWKYDMWLPRAIAEHEKYPKHHSWWTVTSDYANGDSAATRAIFSVQVKLLKQRDLWEIYLERLKLLPIIYKMESVGVTFNKERLDKLVREYSAESERSATICLNIANGLNYDLILPKSGNNKSLRAFVFDKLKLPVIARSDKTGEPSLDKLVMEEYEAVLPPRSKQLIFVKALRGKRKRDTAIGYMESYKKFGLLMNGHRDWFVLHPSLNITGTDTTRCSSQSPNEQNISKLEGFNLRYCFGPAPGREWWSLDAKNIELRLPAYESGEQELIDLFERSKEPPYYGSFHLLNFSTIYPDIWQKELKDVGFDKVGPQCKKKYESSWYQWCKNGNFAVQYGAIDREDGEGTADKAFHKKGAHALLKARFNKLEKLNQHCIRFADRHGYIETIPDKSVNPKHGYPLLCTRNNWGKIKPTVPLNYHTQGSAGWWMCKAEIRCFPYLEELTRKDSRGYYMVMQIHDELVFDFPFEPDMGNLPKIKECKRLMELGGDDYGIPTPVDIEYNPVSWSEGVAV
jgi:DNA polymerase I-like protein with 3'-5' exonuclease and polymerase domains